MTEVDVIVNHYFALILRKFMAIASSVQEP